ncbi:MAG: hypothetical protein AB8F95_06020, partial [Bacteroidia bacterium]
GSSRIVQQYDWQGQMLKEYQTVDTSSSGKAEGLAVLPSGKFSFIMNSQDFLHYDYIPVPVRSAYPTFVSLDQQGDTLISIPIDSLRHSQQVRNAASDTKGNIVFAGMYSVIDSVLPTKNYGYMGKVSAQGKLLWSRPYTFSYTDHPDTVTYVRPLEAIIATDDGGAAAVGSFGAILSGVGKSHGWIIRVDSFGCVIPGCHLAPNSIAPALSKARLLIAPNPASDITYAHWLTEEPGEAVFSLRDAHGRLIRQWTNIQPEMTFVIPLQELASGMYYLDVLHHGRMLEGKKLVKQ